MTDFDRIGARLRAERKRLGLNQDQLAEAMGVARGTVVSSEAGRTCPDLLAMERARSIGMDTWWVQTGERQGITEAQWAVLNEIALGVDDFITKNSIPRTVPVFLGLLQLAHKDWYSERSISDVEPNAASRAA